MKKITKQVLRRPLLLAEARGVSASDVYMRRTQVSRAMMQRRPTTADALVIKEIFSSLQKTYPHAQCELLYNNDFQLLLAVLLSAQTTDKAVNKALAPLYKKHPQFSPRDLIEMGELAFLQAIKTIGLAPTKARHSVQMAQQLCQKHGEKVPLNREDLESLPGVGRKTANVVLNVLAGEPTIAVDTHVFRLSKRLGFVPLTASREQTEAALLKCVPQEFVHQAHHLLIFHGRYHCTAKNPQCEKCQIEALCSKQGVP